MFTLPNIISLSRLPLAILIIIWANSFWKFIFLFFALLLDILDGYIAKKTNQTTKLGALLDPLMDKIFCLIIFIFFFIKLNLPSYFIFLFFLRDLIFIPLPFFRKLRKIKLQTRFFGKKVTGAQFITLFLMMLGNIYWIKIGMYVIFFFSLVAIIDYSIQVSKTIKKL